MLAKRLRKNIVLFYIFALTLFLELAFTNYFGVFNIRPDIFVILVIFLSVYSSREISFYTSVSLGILKDILGITPLGVYILGFLLCRFVVEKLKRKIYPGRIIIDAALVCISATTLYLYLSLIARFQNSLLMFKKVPLGLILASTFYTTLISIPLFLIFKKIKASQKT